MDFTNLEETAREAKLDYDESESLLRFLNFQRERRGEPPIYADYGQLCDHLSEIYPDVEFNLAEFTRWKLKGRMRFLELSLGFSLNAQSAHGERNHTN